MAVVELGYLGTPPTECRDGVVAVGNFDGVHRGHAALVDVARAMASRVGGPVVPVTFDPHPLQLLAPDRYQPPLTTVAERARLLQTVGADHVIVLRTTPELLALSPEYFFETLVARAIRARGVVEGFNFRFGHNRAGSNDTLRALCVKTAIEFQEVPAFELDGRPVSSSRVRDAVAAGDMTEATTLLGRPYRLSGVVGTGMKRGRTIGFPTANLHEVATLIPVDGVYAVSVTTATGRYAGAAHVGPNVTFGEHVRQVEVYLIDFSGDLYGQELSCDFVARVRGTQKFSSVDELVGQMRRDVERAGDVVAACGVATPQAAATVSR
jgi:riboflavin kinase/FMN adenylyltransferase